MTDLEKKREQLLIKLQSLETSIATERCPFKIGDIVQGTKHHPKQYQINLIIFQNGGYGYRIRGMELKKNGTPGKRQIDLWNLEELQKIK